MRIKFVQVPEQKTLFEYYMRDVIFPSTTSIHQKSGVLDLSVYTLFPLLLNIRWPKQKAIKKGNDPEHVNSENKHFRERMLFSRLDDNNFELRTEHRVQYFVTTVMLC